jgi:hypothetical protein
VLHQPLFLSEAKGVYSSARVTAQRHGEAGQRKLESLIGLVVGGKS